MASFTARFVSAKMNNFPLPTEAFPVVRATRHEIAQYEAQALQLATDAIREAEQFDHLGADLYNSAAWEQMGASDGLRVFRRGDATHDKRAQYRVGGVLQGHVRQFMQLLYADSTEALFERQQILDQNAVLDAVLLARFHRQSSECPHRFLGIAWLAVLAAGGKAHTSFVEYLNYLQDTQGRTLGVRVVVPIDLQELEPAMEAMKVRRFEHSLVQVFRPDAQRLDLTQYFLVAHFDHAVFEPTSFAKQLMDLAAQYPVFAEARELSSRGLLNEGQWTAETRGCSVCAKTFNAMRTRYHCRLCGTSICRKCVTSKTVPVRSSGSHDRFCKLDKVKFCLGCIKHLWPDFNAPWPPTKSSMSSQSSLSTQSTQSSMSSQSQPMPPNRHRHRHELETKSIDSTPTHSRGYGYPSKSSVCSSELTTSSISTSTDMEAPSFSSFAMLSDRERERSLPSHSASSFRSASASSQDIDWDNFDIVQRPAPVPASAAAAPASRPVFAPSQVKQRMVQTRQRRGSGASGGGSSSVSSGSGSISSGTFGQPTGAWTPHGHQFSGAA